MKLAKILSLAMVVCAVSRAEAEEISLSCVVSSQGSAPQNLIVKISEGRVRYGASATELANADSMVKGSLSISASQISFRQTWPATHVQWDWSINRGNGAINIKYINTATKKPFLTKRGECGGG